MKKILYILLSIFLLTACSSDDDNGGSSQNKTSYVIKQTYRDSQPNTVVGYKKNGIYVQLAQYGDLKKNVVSKEVSIETYDISEIFIFYTDELGSFRINEFFKIEKNKKNTIEISGSVSAIPINKNEPAEYPIKPY